MATVGMHTGGRATLHSSASNDAAWNDGKGLHAPYRPCLITPPSEGDAMPMRQPSPVLNVAETALTNMMLGAIGVVTGILSARWLGPDGRGELAAIQMWPSVLAALATMGLHDALVYFSAKHSSESRRYLLTAVLIASIAMPVFVAVGYALMPHLLSMESARIVRAARVYLILVPLYLFVGLPHQLLRGIQRYRLWNVLRTVFPVLWLFVLVVAVLLGVTDPARMTGAYMAVLAVAGPLVTWIVWRESAGRGAPTKATARMLLKFGLPSALATLPQFFNLKLDQLMVAAVVPARQLGIYMVAVAWGSCVPMLSSALAMIVSTQIAAGTSDSERNRRFRLGVCHSAWLIAIPVVLLAAATPLGLTMVFGRAFRTAMIPAAILIVASGVNALNGALEELLRGYGCPAATLWAEGTAVAVGLPALLLLLPRAGLTGAGLGSLISALRECCWFRAVGPRTCISWRCWIHARFNGPVSRC
jgi:O-antigen/teichoic acid export membrane protein